MNSQDTAGRTAAERLSRTAHRGQSDAPPTSSTSGNFLQSHLEFICASFTPGVHLSFITPGVHLSFITSGVHLSFSHTSSSSELHSHLEFIWTSSHLEFICAPFTPGVHLSFSTPGVHLCSIHTWSSSELQHTWSAQVHPEMEGRSESILRAMRCNNPIIKVYDS